MPKGEKPTMKRMTVAVDIGGTNLRCALADVNDPERIIARRVAATPATAGPNAIVDFISAEVDLCLSEIERGRESLVSVGCTAPGITDAARGVVVSAANLSGWEQVPLASMLEQRFGVATAVENDVKAAALGEFRYGAGRGSRSLVYMTVSTGVAAGIVIEGKVLRGHNHCAGEIGYFVTEPTHIGKDWGHNGCLELTAAGIGIAQEWTTRHERSGTIFSAIDVFAAARAGNVDAERIVERAGDYLAQAAIGLCTIIDPELLVLGGGIAENEPVLRNRISEAVRETLPFPPQVVETELRGDAPLVGAVIIALEKVQSVDLFHSQE